MLKNPIFIGGAGRSGTSLIRVILDSHPNIACGPEFKMVPTIAEVWGTGLKVSGLLKSYQLTPEDWSTRYRRFISSLLEPYLRSTGKKRLAEKSPNNVFYFYHLHMIFPDARFIQMVRDGRDVVSSLLAQDWHHPRTGAEAGYTQSPTAAAQYWTKAVETGFRAAEQMPDGFLYTLRYEDLIQNPEPNLRSLLEFLGEPWDPQVLEYHRKDHKFDTKDQQDQVSQKLYTKAMGRWRNDLDNKAQAEVYEVAGQWLEELGYVG